MIKLIPLSPIPNYLSHIAKWRNMQPEILRNGFTFNDYENQKLWLKEVQKNNDKYFFVFKDNTLQGYCGLSKIDPWNRSAEISILFNPVVETQSLYNDTLKELIIIGFDNLDLHRLFVEVYMSTKPNRLKFIHGTGFFVDEGCLRDTKYWNSKWYDSWIGSIINPKHKDNVNVKR